MKRHKSLYPLSHDHHHVLVQARHLRVTASENAETASLHQNACNYLAYWENNLQAHFLQEENILLPVFSQYASSNSQINEILQQHAEIQILTDQLKKEIEDKLDLSLTCQQLSDLLSRHIRYEEQILFPAIQEMLPEDILWKINRKLISEQ